MKQSTISRTDGGFIFELRQTLNIVEGKEYVTLITCTPTGVNTHRLLVRGYRSN